jgi:DNA repair protein RadA/Sms
MTSSLILIGGPPGIGKSTLMLQASSGLASGAKVLYVSGEESLEQVKNRAQRTGVADSENLLFMSETDLGKIISESGKIKPAFVVVDSIQTVFKEDVPGSPGSVSQVRECAAELLRYAKGAGVTVFLLGHVTKEGEIAGPNVLEHIVDTVLYFEAEKNHAYRILRSYKNRFGPTSEIGVFEMKQSGLSEVKNPSALFLSERAEGVPGSAVAAVMEGSRPLLVEVQALVSGSSFGMPRRVATGIDYNRTVLLISILENRAGLGLESHDVFVNVAGGAKLKEPSSDLAVCCAVFSAFAGVAVPCDAVFIGEVGLGGEIRGVGFVEERIKEAGKLGFKRIFIPGINAAGASRVKVSAEVVASSTVSQVIGAIRDGGPETKKS